MTAPTSWDELQVGATAPAQVDRALTITDFVRYQGSAGDLNPIHHDVEFARRAGYSGPFAVGMLAAGRAAGYLTAWLGPRNVRCYRVRFGRQAWPGDRLSYEGRVTGRDGTSAERCVQVEIVCTRPDGEVHLTAWATVRVPGDHD